MCGVLATPGTPTEPHIHAHAHTCPCIWDSNLVDRNKHLIPLTELISKRFELVFSAFVSLRDANPFRVFSALPQSRAEPRQHNTNTRELLLETFLAIWFGNKGRPGNCGNDKPGPVTSYRGGDPPQHEAGLQGWDRQGACHPRLRGWDNRSPGPVYGSPLAAAAAFS